VDSSYCSWICTIPRHVDDFYSQRIRYVVLVPAPYSSCVQSKREKHSKYNSRLAKVGYLLVITVIQVFKSNTGEYWRDCYRPYRSRPRRIWSGSMSMLVSTGRMRRQKTNYMRLKNNQTYYTIKWKGNERLIVSDNQKTRDCVIHLESALPCGNSGAYEWPENFLMSTAPPIRI